MYGVEYVKAGHIFIAVYTQKAPDRSEPVQKKNISMQFLIRLDNKKIPFLLQWRNTMSRFFNNIFLAHEFFECRRR